MANPRLIVWDADIAQRELSKRLRAAKDARKKHEYQWELNERTVYSSRNPGSSLGDIDIPIENSLNLDGGDVDDGSSNISMNRILKNIRFLHSQMSANPPTVLPRPASADLQDRRCADAADRVVRHNIRQYDLPENFDLSSLNTLLYGTSFIKTIFNPHLGEVIDYDEESGEVLMEGDFEVTTPLPWHMFPCPDAERADKLTWIFEEIFMPYEEALALFPDKKDVLETARLENDERKDGDDGFNGAFRRSRYNVVKVYEYWEKGLPENGLIGRYVYCLENGVPLCEVKPNPSRFKPKPDSKIEVAKLPYHISSDIDLPGTIWGQSVIAYAAPLQLTLNQMDNSLLDAMEAHAVARLVLPDNGEVADDVPSNSSFDVIKISGIPGFQPNFVEAMPWPESFFNARQSIIQMIDDIMGINESMFGQQSREQSGFSMQYATNQGNMVRRRLFNKYVKQVESVHKFLLQLAAKHWTESRTIKVLGNENAFEAYDIKAADIAGGFDLVVEYGASLSLDPTTRREEIITLMPLFEKAGIAPRTIMGFLKLNELDNLYDRTQLAANRQKEYFDEMVAENKLINPRELEEHQYMLEYAYGYVMTAEFKYLPEESKALIVQHIKMREQLAAQGPAGAQTGAPGPAGIPGAPAALPGATGGQVTEGGAPPIVPGQLT